MHQVDLYEEDTKPLCVWDFSSSASQQGRLQESSAPADFGSPAKLANAESIYPDLR